MAELVDNILLGLVDCLVPVCWVVYRPRFQGSDYPSVLLVCASRPGFSCCSVDGYIR